MIEYAHDEIENRIKESEWEKNNDAAGICEQRYNL